MGGTCQRIKECLQIVSSAAAEDISLTHKTAWQSSSRQCCSDVFSLLMPADQDAEVGGIKILIVFKGLQDQVGHNPGDVVLNGCAAAFGLMVFRVDVEDLK